MSFDNYVQLHNHHNNPHIEHFHHPKLTCTPSQSIPPHLQPQTITDVLSISFKYSCLLMYNLYKANFPLLIVQFYEFWQSRNHRPSQETEYVYHTKKGPLDPFVAKCLALSQAPGNHWSVCSSCFVSSSVSYERIHIACRLLGLICFV